MFRILLVEDDPEISGVLERQLTAWNYQVGLIRDFRDVLGDFLYAGVSQHHPRFDH